MSRLLKLLELQRGSDSDTWIGPASGPEGKRAFGGQFVAQSLAAACRTVEGNRLPTNMHLQFLRGGEAGEPVEYSVVSVFDGRTAAARRVDSRQDGRLLTTSTVSFAVDLPGPEHGRWDRMVDDPDVLPQTGPAGPAPSMPLDELDIRITDDRSSGEFVRRFWWRATVPIPDDPLVHTLVAVYVTDVYMIDPALQVVGPDVVRLEARRDRSRARGARAFDEGPQPSKRHDRFIDLVPSAGSRGPMESAGNPITGRRAWPGRGDGKPRPQRWRHCGHPRAGRAYRRAGTEAAVAVRSVRSRAQVRIAFTSRVSSTPMMMAATTPSRG